MLSPFAFAAGLLRRMTQAGAARGGVEILPPEQDAAPPDWDLNMSVEERAETFAAMFLDASPTAPRSARAGE